ncbi:MAG: HlyD family secretion protein [Nodosilinea sp.]
MQTLSIDATDSQPAAAVEPSPTSEPKSTLRSDELLPALGRWASLTGLVLMGSLGVVIAGATVAKYNVAVKATATVRPTGELRVVQAELEGKVNQLVVEENQPVRRGDAIAYLDDTKLQIQKTQLQGSLQQNQLQLAQVESQVRFLNLQLLAEDQSTARSIAAAEADLRRTQRETLEKTQTTQADFEEAQVALTQAQNEYARFLQLAEAGAIAQSVLQEKQTAVETAQIRLERAQAGLNPSQAGVAVAQQQVAQQAARGASTLANLRKEREALVQRQSEIQAQMIRDQKELQQVDADLENIVIRASSDGVVFKLNLANADQVVRAGDTIAQIAPAGADLVIRAMVANQDIDKVALGQTAQLRVEACPYPDYGVLMGQVTAIAADVTSANSRGAEASSQGNNSTSRDGGKGDRTFEVTIQPDTTVLQKGRLECPIQAGMAGNASIVSRRETFLQFVLRKARLWSSI